MNRCAHSKERRALLAGYDVVCDDCGQPIGRVALFPCAVLSRAEAAELLGHLPTLVGKTGRDARARLEEALRSSMP